MCEYWYKFVMLLSGRRAKMNLSQRNTVYLVAIILGRKTHSHRQIIDTLGLGAGCIYVG